MNRDMDSIKTVFITGASGSMGMASLREIFENRDTYNRYKLILLVRDSEKNREEMKPFSEEPNLEIVWGDLLDFEKVKECVKEADLIVHIAAFVSPAADYHPEQAMKINYGSTRNLIRAIVETGGAETKKFVYIGTVAETGDRMPPIHWGRVGDPIKPSMFDYYAVSKVAAERLVIESGLKKWVSLRQTGIMGPDMAKIRDAIQFHNCLDNVLEYVSDRDSGRLVRNLCAFDADGSLDASFWGHIYNIGGGESCRVSTYDMYKAMYGRMGFTDLAYVIDARYTAARNFHGQYYLDSDRLEEYLHFRHDSMEYFYDAYLKEVGNALNFAKGINRLPGGQRMMGKIIQGTFEKNLLSEHGTKRWIRDGAMDRIDAYWGGMRRWVEIPKDPGEMKHFTDWDNVVRIDHGFDEEKPESELTLDDVKQAAEFRGGACLSEHMDKGDWTTKLTFRCAFGHTFEASPRLILEGGHWCPVCERKSWNYGNRAKVDPFFAQVWTPLHGADETREYPKIVSEMDV